jgi:nitrogen fixation protein FixH
MTPSNETRRCDRWIPWAFVGFFAIVLAANGMLVYFAAASWTGLDTEEYYIKGLTYNRTLEEAARQRALGWKGTLALRPAVRGGQELALELRDSKGLGLSGGTVQAEFVRPTHTGYDFSVNLTDRGNGRYVAAVALPLPGQWDVRVDVRHPYGAFRLMQRVMAPR